MYRREPSNPLISVIIPTRNRARFLSRALASVWAQTCRDIEVLVVDDGSEDDTPELLEEWQASGRLRWFRNGRPLGACAARNRAIAESAGRYVTGLDDDDEMLPNRIDLLLAALRPGDAFACASDWLQTPDQKRRIRVTPRHIDLQTILCRNVVGNQVFAERSKLLACGGFDESLPSAQDYDMWIRMIDRHGPARGLPTPLQVIHVHDVGSRISTAPARRHGYLTVYRKHRAKMTPGTRASHLYNLHKASRKRLGSRTAGPFFVRGNRLRVVSRLLSERMPFLSNAIQSLSERYVRVFHS